MEKTHVDNNKKKRYLTDLHCHTAEEIAISREEAERLVEIYVNAGYASVVITNHFTKSKLARSGASEWKEQIDFFRSGYDLVKEVAGDRLHVLFGAEAAAKDFTNDYLLYGVTPEYLYGHPGILDLYTGTFCRTVRGDGILLIQAHPFRDDMTLLNPHHLDGYEVFNGSDTSNSRNWMAEMWANMHGKIMTAGSDHHCPWQRPDAGILTEEPIVSEAQLVRILRSGRYDLYRARIYYENAHFDNMEEDKVKFGLDH